MSVFQFVAMCAVPIMVLIFGGQIVGYWNERVGFGLFIAGLLADLALFFVWGIYGIWWVAHHLCY